jgi:hypothetical protein
MKVYIYQTEDGMFYITDNLDSASDNYWMNIIKVEFDESDYIKQNNIINNYWAGQQRLSDIYEENIYGSGGK